MTILITGARSNIGYKIAKLLAKRGHIVYAGCKTKEEVKTLEEKIDKEKIIIFPIVLDLVKDNSKLIDSLDIDCLVLQASISNGGSVLEISNNRFNEVIDVNIKGNFRLIQDYLRYGQIITDRIDKIKMLNKKDLEEIRSKIDFNNDSLAIIEPKEETK